MNSKRSILPGVSIVIPVYNSEATIPELCRRVCDSSRELRDAFELILINDGSSDNSWEVISRLAATSHQLQGVNLMRNFGQHNALLCGIRAARHDVIVTMDDDLQHPPEEISKLLGKLDQGYDVVYGSPEKEQHGLWRDLASQITKLALRSAMGATYARDVSAFRAFRCDLREAFANYQGSFVSIDVLLTWATTRFASVVVRHEPRASGKSNYTLRKLVIHSLNMMTGFSTLPLQFASVVGFIFAFFGIAVLLFVVLRYLIQGASVPGFAFLASIIAIFAGAQLFALGIIGEYLARMHFRMMERPAYAVSSRTPVRNYEQQ